MTWYSASAAGVLQLRWLAEVFRTDEADILRGVAKLVKLGHIETAGMNPSDELRITLVRAIFDNNDITENDLDGQQLRGSGFPDLLRYMD